MRLWDLWIVSLEGQFFVQSRQFLHYFELLFTGKSNASIVNINVKHQNEESAENQCWNH